MDRTQFVCGVFAYATAAVAPAFGQGAFVTPETMMVVTAPDTELRMLWLLTGTSEGVFGYTLDLNAVTPVGTGVITADVGATNFFESRNVIAAGGAMLDTTFSVINSDGMDGVFISANTADLSAVAPVDGVNDVLAEVVFSIPSNAEGEFMFTLGGASVLSDVNGQAIPFQSAPLVINVVVPAPGVLSAVALGLVLRRRRC